MGLFLFKRWKLFLLILNGVLTCGFQFSDTMKPTSAETENKNGLLLYLHNYSFYSQKVLMALHEKKLAHKTHSIDIAKAENYQPWFLEINPRGEIPVLKDGVKIIPDSARIIEYLEDNFSNGDTPRLIPLNQGAEVRQKIEFFHELINKIPANVVTVGTFYHSDLVQNPRLPFIAPVRAVMKSNDANWAKKLRGIAEKSPPGVKEVLLAKAAAQDENHALVTNREAFLRLLDQVDDTLAKVEDHLATRKEGWLVTDSFTVADIDLSVLLERLSQVGLAARLWEGRRPLTQAYYARAAARESFVRTMPTLLFHAQELLGGKALVIGGTAVLAATVAAAAVYFYRRSH